MRIPAPFLVALTLFVALPGWSQNRANRAYPPVIDGAKEHVYKTVGDVELKLWEISPSSDSAESSRPAIIFFFGGGWRSGSPTQFVPQSRHLAERGMVAFVADYRVASRHGTKAKDCVVDARDAIRFVRKNAAKLGIDPDRIAAGGGSAGGHIAACLGVISEDEASRVDALALFNPACVLAPIDGWTNPRAEGRADAMRERMGADPVSLSPAHHVSEKAPPTVIFHGKDDTTVAFATAKIFADRMEAVGVDCTLHAYEGEGHGFFNYGRKSAAGGDPPYEMTLQQLDEFLVGLGWLEKK